jgi:DNA polymerase-3 subunit epsilon
MHTISLPEFGQRLAQLHPHPRDRSMAIGWAKRLLQRRDWVILDTETTGLDRHSEVIQIGVIAADGKVLFESFVRPMRTSVIPVEATAVHGITMAMVEDAPVIGELIPKLRGLLCGKTTVMYNAAFDTRLLRQVLEQDAGATLQDIALRPDCAMKMYSAFVGEWMNSKGDYRWQKLPGAAHGAIEDCQATLSLIRHMAQADDSKTLLDQTWDQEDFPARLFAWAVIVLSVLALAYVILSQ